MTEQEPLLDMTLNAVIEALRMNPDRYNVIYNNKYEGNETVFDSSRDTTESSYSSHSHSSLLQNHDYYYNKYHEGLV